MNDVTNVIAVISLLCNCCSMPILFGTLMVAIWQTNLSRKANHATAYKAVIDILQTQDIRDARNHVMETLKDKPYEKWNPKDRLEASKVCHSYDAVGQMVRNGMLPKEYVIHHWAAGLRNSWDVLAPYIKAMREKVDFAKHWDDYEYLVKETERFFVEES